MRPPAHRRLVEPEVVDLAGYLTVLDEVDTAPGQAGEQQRRRVDLTDVPQAGQRQPVPPGRAWMLRYDYKLLFIEQM